MREMARCRIGFDIGGTFTDVVLFNEETGQYKSVKVSSTPADPSTGAAEGIEKILSPSYSGQMVKFLCHGTTVGTNAILEGKLAKTALVTTKGFRDVLEIGRQRRPDQYNFFAEKPRVLVPRALRFTLNERINYKGEVVKKLEEFEIDDLINRLQTEKVESVAVSFLFSFLNGEHEEKVGKVIRENFSHIHVFLSSEVLPEYREYERTSTVCLNAAVAPVVSRYVENLEKKIASTLGIRCGMNLMKSSGGIMPSTAVSQRAVETVLSGPAAGAISCSYLGETIGYKKLIGFDMGGTSTDISVIIDGKPRLTTEGRIGAYPFRLPIIDINTIGAGGGSIAWTDVAKGLHVGPQSAGADPGPVSYGKGGQGPTVTDANLCLGRINEKFFLGGEMALDKEASKKAILGKIGNPLLKNLAEACQGILDVTNSNMIRAIRVSSMERGLDPREFALVAFGGAGPLHAGDLAEELGISTIIVPEMAGLFSAIGLLVADIKNDYSVTKISKIRETDHQNLLTGFEELKERAIAEFKKDNLLTERIHFIYSMDMRYSRQAYEINIPIWIDIDQLSLEKCEKEFHKAHEQLYWWSDPNRPVEVVNLRISAISEVPKIKPQKKESKGEDPRAALKGVRHVFFREFRDFKETGLYQRALLDSGNVIEGPAIIESFDTTVVVLPSHRAEVDEYGNIIIHTRRR
jgi:N-methylhydantoinase A